MSFEKGKSFKHLRGGWLPTNWLGNFIRVKILKVPAVIDVGKSYKRIQNELRGKGLSYTPTKPLVVDPELEKKLEELYRVPFGINRGKEK